jgi:hypothetical protein
MQYEWQGGEIRLDVEIHHSHFLRALEGLLKAEPHGFATLAASLGFGVEEIKRDV